MGKFLQSDTVKWIGLMITAMLVTASVSRGHYMQAARLGTLEKSVVKLEDVAKKYVKIERMFFAICVKLDIDTKNLLENSDD